MSLKTRIQAALRSNLGVVVSIGALVLSIIALIQTNNANELSEEANTISEVALLKADEAKTISEADLRRKGVVSCIAEAKEAIDSMLRRDPETGQTFVSDELPPPVDSSVRGGVYKEQLARVIESRSVGDGATDLNDSLDLYKRSLEECRSLKERMGEDCKGEPVRCGKVYTIVLTDPGLDWLVELPGGTSLVGRLELDGADIATFIQELDEPEIVEWLSDEPFAEFVTPDDIYEWAGGLTQEDFDRWLITELFEE